MNQEFINTQYQIIAKQERLLPLKVSPFYDKKVEEERKTLNHCNGPLHKIVYPTQEKISLRLAGEVNDFVDDRSNMPFDFLVQKYEDRVLILASNVCASHCQYCFRQDVLSDLHKDLNFRDKIEPNLDLLRAYLDKHPSVNEIILSGGDPLVLPYVRIKRVLDFSKEMCKDIRIHTRTIVFSPKVFSDKLIEALRDANARLVFHIVHPYEICDVVETCISRLNSAGIRLYNQFPILRGINDHPVVLRELLTRLDEMHIRNLSMFIPDPVKYSASFRVRLKRLFSLVDNLNKTAPSWVNSTRLVLDTPFGKVRQDDLEVYDNNLNQAVFQRYGHKIIYPDIPESVDVPGQLETLLWKGSLL